MLVVAYRLAPSAIADSQRVKALKLAEEYDPVLEEFVVNAADYVVRLQEDDGELPYQLVFDIESEYLVITPDTGYEIRSIAGVGNLFNVCSYTGDRSYCDQAEAALEYYVNNNSLYFGEEIDGIGYLSGDSIQLGGTALLVDALYKKATANDGRLIMYGQDFTMFAEDLGENILWMKDPGENYFYHSYNVIDGKFNEGFQSEFFDGEALQALLQIYELTGEQKWLDEALALNEYMQDKSEHIASQDHWHAYGLYYLSRNTEPSEADIDFAYSMVNVYAASRNSYFKSHSSAIGSGTRIEALAALRAALINWGLPIPSKLDLTLYQYIEFLYQHQLPNDEYCHLGFNQLDAELHGGIFTSCNDDEGLYFIRIDGVQHATNGVILYLETK